MNPGQTLLGLTPSRFSLPHKHLSEGWSEFSHKHLQSFFLANSSSRKITRRSSPYIVALRTEVCAGGAGGLSLVLPVSSGDS